MRCILHPPLTTMMILFFKLLLVAVTAVSCTPDGLDPRSDAYIDYLNGLGTTWKAGRNFPSDASLANIRAQLGALDVFNPQVWANVPVKRHEIRAGEIPEEFDARKHWPKCTGIGRIRDQGSCGSCWAFGAVESMSDRICIASNQTMDIMLSAQHLLSCCFLCGMGCKGGYIPQAWQYWVEEGIVTGGLYGTHDTCQPYSIAECEHHVEGKRPPCKGYDPTPHCQKKCTEPSYTKRTYEQDHHFGQSMYQVEPTVENIQKEIMTHGPVEASMFVYEDFLHYKSGVYQRTNHSKSIGGHAIRVLGWGVDQGTPYWIVANSWNTDWGEDGFFRIRRGTNEASLEHNLMGGLPKLS